MPHVGVFEFEIILLAKSDCADNSFKDIHICDCYHGILKNIIKKISSSVHLFFTKS